MPKQFFQRFPVTEYDVDNSGEKKTVVDVLRRVKARAEALSDGGVFYNYTMQEGDNPEIIADKYYGSSQYHWVVMMMNDRIDPTYDFTLDDLNFENYIAGKYGSVDQAKGLVKTLTKNPDTGTLGYVDVSIVSQWHEHEQHRGSGFGANTCIDVGTMPAGHSTAIVIKDAKTNGDPFSGIHVGDVVTIFIPEDWYDSTNTTLYPKSSYATSAKVTGRSTCREFDVNGVPVDVTYQDRDFFISLDLNSNTYPLCTWGTEEEETVSIQTGIHHYEMSYYNFTGTVSLADSVWIDQTRYANNSDPNSFSDLSKKLVSNYTYEDLANEDKRNIVLLKEEYLSEFVTQFNALIGE
jgi:hypothetical protein